MEAARGLVAALFRNAARWLVAGVIALSASAAFAGEWSWVGGAKDEVAYLDRSSVMAEGKLIKARVLRSYSQVQTIGDNAFQHKSQILNYAVRCEDRSIGFESWLMTTGEIGTGSTVWAGQVNHATFYRAALDPIAEQVVGAICG